MQQTGGAARWKVPLAQQIRTLALRGLRTFPQQEDVSTRQIQRELREQARTARPIPKGIFPISTITLYQKRQQKLVRSQLHAFRMYNTKQDPLRVDAQTKDLGVVFREQYPQARLKVTPKSYVPAGQGHSIAPSGRVLLPPRGVSAALLAHELGHLASYQHKPGKFLHNMVLLADAPIYDFTMSRPKKILLETAMGLAKASRGVAVANLLMEYDATRRGLKLMQQAGYSAKEVARARKRLLGALGTYAAPQFPRTTRALQRIHTARRRYGKIKGLFKTLAKVR